MSAPPPPGRTADHPRRPTARRCGVAAGVLLLAAGCAGEGGALGPSAGPSLAGQQRAAMRQERFERYARLLDFESPADAAFVSPRLATSADGGHTGAGALRVRPGLREVAVDLGPLLAGRGDLSPASGEGRAWTLLGAYVWSDRPGVVEARLATGGGAGATAAVPLTAGAWTAVMVDLAGGAGGPIDLSSPGGAVLSLRLPTSAGAVALDDVMLADNRRTLVAADAADRTAGMAVRRVGHRLVVEGVDGAAGTDDGPAVGPVALSIPLASGSPDGWSVVEAGPLRLRLVGGPGDAVRPPGSHEATLWRSGRVSVDGAAVPLGAIVGAAVGPGGEGPPGRASVPPAMGRVDRTTPGDADNDGYNERLGAYQVRAGVGTGGGGRLEVTLTPAGSPLRRPAVEASGLPAGPVLATVGGRLVESVDRLPDGRVLVELPFDLDRPATLVLRVR